MQLPLFLLSQTAVYEAPAGVDGFGRPVPGAQMTFSCRIEPKQSQAVNGRGEVVLATAKLYCRPDVPLQSGGTVTWNGHKYQVIDVQTQYGLGGPCHIEAVLR